MGFSMLQKNGSNFMRSLTRRKQVDCVNARRDGGVQLAKTLTVLDLIAIGIGSTIGAGVYILVGTVAREHTGPALTISFLIAGIAAALSAFCYAELACRCPSAGSAYHYSYICVGEGVAWLIGWALILEYTIGGSAVARGTSPNLALFFGGQENLPAFLAQHTIPRVGIVVDPCAAILVLIVTGLLCIGIKESTVAQSIVTTINLCALVFVIIAGTYLGFKTGWVGYELPKGYFPFGVNGMIAGSSVVFFSYIGFDSITSTAEEVKHPQRDLPLGIAISLAISCILYMLVSVAIVGIVPYYSLDPDTPISSAFSTYGMQWAAYIITSGAVTALVASLMGSILPQPRILMAMARDGLLPSFFSNINKDTQVPVNSTIVTGVLAAALAFCMDVSQLAGMVSVGTLLAFTTVAISVLIIRYVPPEVVSTPPSLQDPSDSYDILEFSQGTPTYPTRSSEDDGQHLLYEVNLARSKKEVHGDEEDDILRRRFATWAISLICVGAIMVASGASSEFLASHHRIILCLVGALILLCSLCVLACIDQDDARHSFGHRGGFICPLVPYLPVACILINTYLLVNLGAGTWLRVSIWLLLGALLYLCYGRSRSTLSKVVCTPTGGVELAVRS